MEKLNPDDTGVHEPAKVGATQGEVSGVKRLNRRLIVGVAAVALAVMAIAFVWSVQKKAAKKPEKDDEAQHAIGQNPSALVDGLIKDSERQKLSSLQDELKKEEKIAEAEAIQQALEASVEEAEEEQKKVEDPWEKARVQAQQRNAQAYFQDAHGARKSDVFAMVGKPPGGAATPVDEGDLDVAQERRANASRMKEFEAAQSAPIGFPSSAPPPSADPKEEFFNRKHNGATRSFASLEVPMSDFELQAGTILPMVLETAIDSDLPGLVKARVASPVYDTVTGRHLLIPSGAVVIGEYSSSQSFGQNRLQVAWTRLILPNGKSLTLGNLPGVSLDGSSGLSDQTDEHWDRIIAGALFSSALAGAGAAAGGNRNEQNVRPEQEALSGAASQIVKSGDAITAKNLEIQPTIRIRAGMRVSAFVREDLILEPYQN